MRLLSASIWLSLGLAATYRAGPTDSAAALLVVSVLSLAFGVWAFLWHGGARITAAGMFCAAAGAFVGYAGLWWLNAGPVQPEMFWAALASHLATVTMLHLFWWETPTPKEPAPRDPATALRATNLGLILGAAALVAHVALPGVAAVTEDAAFVGIVVMTIGLTGTSDRFNVGGPRAVLIAGFLAAFVVVAFDGFGRLPVLALGASVAIVVSLRQRRRLLKVAALLLVPVAAAMLTALRTDRLGTSGTGRGPDSDVGGLFVFARLVANGLDDGHGSTFWATATIWIPRGGWEGKPIGFGAELTRLLEPAQYGTGQSLVATAFGEWFFNFGWVGIPLMVVVVGLAVRWLDRLLAGVAASPLDSMRAVLLTALLVAVVASLTDFVWSGTFTLAARMLLRAAVIVALLSLVGRAGASRSRRAAADALSSRPGAADPIETSRHRPHRPARAAEPTRSRPRTRSTADWTAPRST